MTRSLAMLTDYYELTMASAYWKNGMADTEAVFHLFFRDCPFGGGYAIACGLAQAIEYLDNFWFDEDDLEFLGAQRGNDDRPIFSEEFLEYLEGLHLSCDVDAVPEGTAVFPHEPIVRVSGPIIQAQLLETTLLNLINFSTLVATKASRIVRAAGGDRVSEFGLRRAQGVDGGVMASRAAYVGGCDGTSNILAGERWGLPVGGTQAHSFVMAFDSEEEAFERWADAMPNNAIFLVDTYASIEGVRRAIERGLKMRKEGHEMVGIRLDSGDIAELSREARRLLDEAGFEDAVIAASNELDEYRILDLKARGARVSLWGVGTRLATCWDQPALGGVYKLSAIRRPGESWKHRIKISEEIQKTSIPGKLQVTRYAKDGQFVADVIHDEIQPTNESTGRDIERPIEEIVPPEGSRATELLVPVFRNGRRVYDPPPIADSRALALEQVAHLPEAITRFDNPERYRVGLDSRLVESRNYLMAHGSSR